MNTSTVFKLKNAEIDSARISKAVFDRGNSCADKLVLTVFDAGDGAVDVSAGDPVEFWSGGVRKFFGFVSKSPRTLSASSQNVEIVAESPWGELERIVYQQLWNSAETLSGEVVLSPVMRSKVVLGQDSNGEKINVGQQVRDILEFAISCGANLQIGTIDLSAEMILDEAKDLSCAEALLRVLKWTPNCAAFFDYSAQGNPKLNVLSRSSLPTIEIDAQSSGVKSVSVASRPDLKVESVSIKYERVHSQNEFSWLTVDEDIYPPDSPSAAKNALVMSVELSGLKQSCQIHEIKCRTIQENSLDWWRDKLPEIAGYSDLKLLGASREYSSLSRELEEGTITSAMGFDAETDLIKGTFEYTGENGSYVRKTISIRTVATNAVTGSYPVWTTSRESEPKPQGLAQAIYEAVCDMQYEADITVFERPSSDFIGRRISLVNADSAWNKLDVPVVSTSEDIMKSTLRIKCGPPKHLYPDNIAELFRINRQRKSPDDYLTRADGKVATASVRISGLSAGRDTSLDSSLYSRFVVEDESSSSGIDLDSRALGENQKAEFKELHFCYEGRLAKGKFLMTEPDIYE